MNIKKMVATGAVALSGLALMGTFALAQNAGHPMSLNVNNEGSVKLSGTVSAVSGNTVSVNSWGGTWQINASNASDIQVGDTVKVNGTVASGMTINAKTILDMSLRADANAEIKKDRHERGILNALLEVRGHAWGLFNNH